MARPTMRDVARHAGVSLKTVSRVINGEPGVASTTATRVTGSIEALGFRRNDLARSLRQGRSSATLGLVIEDVANPFYSVIAQAVEDAAHQRGFMLITGSCQEDPERERELVFALLRRRVDALLIVPAGTDHRYLLPELAAGVPAVFLDRPPQGLDADAVLLDNVGGARRAVEHLIEHGHRRIACITDAAHLHTAAERLAGYRAAVAAAGLPEDAALIRTGARDAATAAEVVEELLGLPEERRPTALFSANNRITIGAVGVLAREIAGGPASAGRAPAPRSTGEHASAGRAPAPRHPVALVGFDDFELADVLAIPVTVIRDDPHRMGAVAADLAFGRLDGDDRPPQRVVVPCELVQRGSGEVAP